MKRTLEEMKADFNRSIKQGSEFYQAVLEAISYLLTDREI